MKKVYLICNAHIDPLWQWNKNEGAAEAISTFRVAADFCEEYDGFILPSSGGIAPKFMSDDIGKLSNRYLLLENHMAIGNFGGFPSITIPSGEFNNMPIGICITGKVKKDWEVLNIAYALEGVFDMQNKKFGGAK